MEVGVLLHVGGEARMDRGTLCHLILVLLVGLWLLQGVGHWLLALWSDSCG